MSTNAACPAGSTWIDDPDAATCRSASVMATESHVASDSNKSPDSAVTRPPEPRSATRAPSSARAKLTGPRFDATTIGASNAVDADTSIGEQPTLAGVGEIGDPAA